jgi:hypothetical protein
LLLNAHVARSWSRECTLSGSGSKQGGITVAETAKGKKFIRIHG